jgi:hypothetical protein
MMSLGHWRETGACDHDVHTENILKIIGSTNIGPVYNEGSEGALHDVLSWTGSNGARDHVVHHSRQRETH